MRPRNPSSYRCLGGSKSDASIYLAVPATLKLNVWLRSLMTLNTPEAKHDHQLQISWLVFIYRLPNHWCIQDLCPLTSWTTKTSSFYWLPAFPFGCSLTWRRGNHGLAWGHGMGRGDSSGGVLLWDLFLPLNLLMIGVVYISSLIGWLFLTRKKTISWVQCVDFKTFSASFAQTMAGPTSRV